MVVHGFFRWACLPGLVLGVLVSASSAQVPLQQVGQGYGTTPQPAYQQPAPQQQAYPAFQQQGVEFPPTSQSTAAALVPFAAAVSGCGADQPGPVPPTTVSFERQPNEHPLMPALRWANSGLQQMEQVRDYSATLVKRERVDGQGRQPGVDVHQGPARAV